MIKWHSWRPGVVLRPVQSGGEVRKEYKRKEGMVGSRRWEVGEHEKVSLVTFSFILMSVTMIENLMP